MKSFNKNTATKYTRLYCCLDTFLIYFINKQSITQYIKFGSKYKRGTFRYCELETDKETF